MKKQALFNGNTSLKLDNYSYASNFTFDTTNRMVEAVTLDLTKPYNDLLSIGNQHFIWGNELIASEGSFEFSYLSDHLGSPIRLMNSDHQDTLAYDDFGIPTVDTLNQYNPFGFTGYQPDTISGTNCRW